LSFHYIEISDVDVSTGRVEGKELLASEAPGRARQLVQAFDVLISTVRPERKGVGIAAVDMDGWIASTGFSILETETPEMAHFLCAALRHDVSTFQMMRWNTGATYPAIDADVPLNVLVPDLNSEVRSEVGKSFQSAIELDDCAAQLVREAKADVEALIEGRLDVEGIVAGQIRPPTWEDVEV
jgi:type I restriction enzyme S subunit